MGIFSDIQGNSKPSEFSCMSSLPASIKGTDEKQQRTRIYIMSPTEEPRSEVFVNFFFFFLGGGGGGGSE